MDNWFRSKWFVRAVSLAFAILLFTFVNVEISDKNAEKQFFGTSKDSEVVDNVPVDIKIDKNQVVSGVPKDVQVQLEGPKSMVAPAAKQRNFDVFVDLRGLDEGEHKVEIQYANVADDVKAYIEPKTVDVVIEERSSKEFNVNVDFINEDQLPDGYEIGDFEVNPQTVTIRSSKSVVDQIAVVKVFVDVAGLTDPIKSREVPVNVYDSQGNELNVAIKPENVEISADINHPNKKVPVSVETTGKLPDGYSIDSVTPKVNEVTLYGPSSSLENINTITTEKIDLSKITKSGTVDVDLDLPDGVKAPDHDSIKVDVEIEETNEETNEDINEEASGQASEQASEEDNEEENEEANAQENEQSKTIGNVPIEVKNLGEDKQVSFVNPENPNVNVEVAGKEEDMDKLTADDFQLSIDADGLDEGEHKVPVTIEGPKDADTKTEVEEATIDITAP
ncbi:CdaR family protein [Lentibacillus sp. L22]|uniref:CdaR family protein n=1 Tax=Lentibacillus TaxID=175304 RepID=UPI0022B1B998|nr:CdaR family protein [Lentibacillus daqui]